ncbi:MAG: 7-cyano-7-deazaguanine synthase QueC [bacterium]|nr:MAG: 7-cyano-7-deazaguanine synthase QueC [bacterium]
MKRGSNKEVRAVALLSGGLDSTVSCAMAARHWRPEAAVFFDYGQRARVREDAAVRGIAERYGLEMVRVELPWLGAISRSVLIEGRSILPKHDPGEPDAAGTERPGAVWVENRNAVFINIAAAIAVARGCEIVVVGFNREEAVAFPDNSTEFVERINGSLELSAGRPVRVESPTLPLTKKEIVREGLSLDIPWHLIWSCYGGEELMCGVCGSCMRLRRAIVGTPVERRFRFTRSEA